MHSPLAVIFDPHCSELNSPGYVFLLNSKNRLPSEYDLALWNCFFFSHSTPIFFSELSLLRQAVFKALDNPKILKLMFQAKAILSLLLKYFENDRFNSFPPPNICDPQVAAWVCLFRDSSFSLDILTFLADA
jgi:hypothetical protein